MRWANEHRDNQSEARRVRSRRSAVRARRQSIAVAVCAGLGVLGLVAVAAPPGGSTVRLVAEVGLAVVAAVAVGVAVDRWNQARIVDLRHHDLFVGIRPASVAAPVAPGSDELDGDEPAEAGPTRRSTHQLFGECDCEDCLAGRPAAVDLRAGAGARSAGRAVVDLRSGATSTRRRRLGQR